MNKHAGFTLIELMIALALGLVVVAAATMLFLTGMRSNAMQQGVSDLQDNANFGLNYITQDVRLANLNNPTAEMNDTLALGGVVLTANNLPTALSGTADNLLSFSGTGASNVNEGSDQLVIQYEPMQSDTYDCEGRLIPDTDRIIIQRYFLRQDTNAGVGEAAPLALACDAAHYNDAGWIGATENAYGGNGEIIMKRVDQFHILLTVMNAANQMRYMNVTDYEAAAVKPRIVGVNLGVLTRSSQNVGSDTAIAQQNNFELLDQDLTVNDASNPTGFIRRVLTQEVAFRNALGDRK